MADVTKTREQIEILLTAADLIMFVTRKGIPKNLNTAIALRILAKTALDSKYLDSLQNEEFLEKEIEFFKADMA